MEMTIEFVRTNNQLTDVFTEHPNEDNFAKFEETRQRTLY